MNGYHSYQAGPGGAISGSLREAYFDARARGGRLRASGSWTKSRRGLAARRIVGEADVRDVVELMRLNYERITARRGGVPGGAS